MPIRAFDAELDAIQSSVGRRFPESAQRDPRFTAAVDTAIKEGVFKTDLGAFYTAYETAYRKMREDCELAGIPLGIIHFDEFHKAPETRNIFDYMADLSSLHRIPRHDLAAQFGDVVARAHRVLLIKAEMQLLPEVYAILPSELGRFRTLALANLGPGSIDEKEQEVRVIPIDLSALSVSRLASLTLDQIQTLRLDGEEYFAAMRTHPGAPGFLDALSGALVRYTGRINSELAFESPSSAQASSLKMKLKVIVGKLRRSEKVRDDLIAAVFSIGGVAVPHSHFLLGRAIASAVLKQLEKLTRANLQASTLESSIDQVKAQFALAKTDEKLAQYQA